MKNVRSNIEIHKPYSTVLGNTYHTVDIRIDGILEEHRVFHHFIKLWTANRDYEYHTQHLLNVAPSDFNVISESLNLTNNMNVKSNLRSIDLLWFLNKAYTIITIWPHNVVKY